MLGSFVAKEGDNLIGYSCQAHQHKVLSEGYLSSGCTYVSVTLRNVNLRSHSKSQFALTLRNSGVTDTCIRR